MSQDCARCFGDLLHFKVQSHLDLEQEGCFVVDATLLLDGVAMAPLDAPPKIKSVVRAALFCQDELFECTQLNVGGAHVAGPAF